VSALHALLLIAPLAAASQTPWAATELAQVVASDGAFGDKLGTTVAICGDTAVLGAPLADHSNLIDAGAVYVYERDQGGPNAWGEVAKLTANDPSDGDEFGFSVDIDGDTIVVGAHWDTNTGGADAGAAYVFARGGIPAWREVAILLADDGDDGDEFGVSVALDGDTVLVGARRDDSATWVDAGAAYLFSRDQGGPDQWGQLKKLAASDGAFNDEFGASVALSGDTAVIGAIYDDTLVSNTGSAYVFVRDQGGPDNWGEAGKLVAADAAVNEFFGAAVAVDGDTAVAGCYLDDHSGFSDIGSAYVFDRGSGGAWSETAKLLSPDGTHDDFFGLDVAIQGGLVLVGAERHDAGGLKDSGAVYVFARGAGGGGAFGLTNKLTDSPPGFTDRYGAALALDLPTVLIGVDQHDFATLAGAGVVLDLQPPPPVVYCTSGTSASGCVASLASSGTPSATAASGFVVTAATVEGAKDGLFFWGTGGRQANPWGTGTSLQCVVPPVKRGALLTGIGTSGTCNGAFTYDLHARWTSKPKQNPGTGATVQAQLWHRDPFSSSNVSTGFSDALEFTVGP
jgi:hypothetical protein